MKDHPYSTLGNRRRSVEAEAPGRDPDSFSRILLDLLWRRGFEAEPDAPDVLADLPYSDELRLKLEAVRRFWKLFRLDGQVCEFVPSVLSRNYRTTSKRRGVFVRGKFELALGYGPGRGSDSARIGAASILECELHNQLYVQAHGILSKDAYLPLARAVNYCVIRGDYEHAGMVMNLSRVNGEIVRKLKLFGEKLRAVEPRLQGLYLFVDESRSDYYFDTAAKPAHGAVGKKIFGPEMLSQSLNGKKLFYAPTSFSQVNGSMVDTFAAAAMDLLKPSADTRVLDLYCGYGLLSMAAAETAGAVFGMEWDVTAIAAASGSAEHLFPGKNLRFFAGAITPDSLGKRLPEADGRPEAILLDPPRSGTAHGVIEALAARRADRVLHVFCGIDEIPRELKIWVSNGYHVSAVRVLDLFPGTMNVETMILLERNRK